MAIFRITGTDERSKIERVVFVRSSSLPHALEAAHADGLLRVDGREATAEEAVGQAILSGEPRRGGGERADARRDFDKGVVLRQAAESPLLIKPIETIAKGVFVGLLFWTLFSILIYFVIFVLMLGL